MATSLGGGPQSASRGVLFGQLLRGGPTRSGPIYDRLGVDGVAHIVTVLSPSELTLLAALVFAPTRVERASTLSTDTLVTLVRAAERPDADRLFDSLSAERGSALRRALCGGDAEELAPAPRANGARSRSDSPRRVRGDTGVGVVLRLRRLFRL
ncbi:MAG: hypothetical protein U1F43_36260 [Myxococcota bacterium]